MRGGDGGDGLRGGRPAGAVAPRLRRHPLTGGALGPLAALTALLAATTLWLGWRYLRTRAARRQEGLFGPWPIRKIPIDALHPRLRTAEFGPSPAAEVSFIGRGHLVVPGGTTDVETWILAVLAKDAAHCFEFGTCTGKTAYLWARNMPPHGRVTTLTLAPDDLDAYREDADDRSAEGRTAREESRFTRFLYTGTDVAPRIEQLYGDSKTFDETPWRDRCDLVFVDGSHAYSYVKSDGAKAMRMVRPGGLVLWHDYDRQHDGVFRALNELARTVDLVHVGGTSLVAWRRPGPAA